MRVFRALLTKIETDIAMEMNAYMQEHGNVRLESHTTVVVNDSGTSQLWHTVLISYDITPSTGSAITSAG